MRDVHVDPDLSAYLDGELAAPERSRVEAHLEGCPRCAARLAELRSTSSLIAALPRLRPARSLAPRVAERWNWLRPVRSLSAVASGAFLFLLTAGPLCGGGWGGGPCAPFGGTAAAPAAAPSPTGAPVPVEPAEVPAADTKVAASATAAPEPQRKAVEMASPTPSAVVREEETRASGDVGAAAPQPSRGSPEPSPASPLLWLALAVIAAVATVVAHRRLSLS